MSTTTIRLPEDLKARVKRAARRAGTTAHGFILEAIADKAERDELRDAFHDTADQRYADIVATGKTIPWAEMRRYMEQRASGRRVPRPATKKPAR